MNPDEYKELKKDLLDILITVTEMRGAVESNHKAFREFEENTKNFRERFDYAIFGNGTPGLKAQYELLKELPEKVQKIEKKLAFYAGGGTVIGVVIGFALQMFVK